MTKIQNVLKAAIVGIVFGASSHAMATTISLTATGLPANGFLSAGHYDGVFNGAADLPKAFKLNSMSFVFNFKDDVDDFSVSPTGSNTNTEWDSKKVGGKTTATATTTTTYFQTSTGEQEKASLSFGSFLFSGLTNAGPTTNLPDQSNPGTPSAAVPAYIRAAGGNSSVICTDAERLANNSCKPVDLVTIVNTVTKTTQTDYTGTITLQGELLTSLFQNKMLSFGLDVKGDLLLTNAALNLDFTETQTAPAPGKVPEPGSLALMGLAFAGLAAARRKKRG